MDKIKNDETAVLIYSVSKLKSVIKKMRLKLKTKREALRKASVEHVQECRKARETWVALALPYVDAYNAYYCSKIVDAMKNGMTRANKLYALSRLPKDWKPAKHVSAHFNEVTRTFKFDMVSYVDADEFSDWLRHWYKIKYVECKCNVYQLCKWCAPSYDGRQVDNDRQMDPEDWLDALEYQLDSLEPKNIMSELIPRLETLYRVAGDTISVEVDIFSTKYDVDGVD